MRLRLLKNPGGSALTPLHAVVIRRGSVLPINICRLGLMRSVIVLQQIVHIQLSLSVGKLANLLNISVTVGISLILAQPALNMLDLVGGHGFGSASRGPQGDRVLRVLALL